MRIWSANNYDPVEELTFFELTDDEAAKYTHDGKEDDTYFRYEGDIHSLANFSSCNGNAALDEWHMYHNDSMCSGVLVRFNADGEIIVGTFCS
jgi:hypothetical protein